MSKWIKDLHIKPDTLNLIEERVVKSLKHNGTGEIFWNRTPMAQALRLTVEKWDLIKLKRKAKDAVKGTKGQPTGWKRRLQIAYLIEG
jgi:hypothetical protein